jgi:hypothetical protein
MTTQAIPGYGTLLKMGDGASPENFGTVVEVTELKPPQISLKTEDATSHDSGGWDEIIATLLSGGEVSGKLNWRPVDPTHNETTGMISAMLNRSSKNWKVVLPNAIKTFSFAGILTDFKPDAPVNGKLAADFTIKISGPVTIG